MINFPDSPTTGDLFTPPPPATGTFRWDGTKWVQLVITGAPNKLLNPFMEIDQANEGAAVTIGTGAYSVDGILLTVGNAGGLVWNAQRVSDAPPGYVYGVRATVATAGTLAANTSAGFQWRLEGFDIEDTRFGTANANSLSLAFWVKASIAGTYSVCLLGAASNRSYCFPLVIAAANTWQLVTQTIPGDTTGAWQLFGNTTQLYLNIYLALGSSFTGVANTWQASNLPAVPGMLTNWITTAGATFTVGPCGLWVAPAPQPLLRTSFQAELARAQRYYEKSYELGTAVGAAVGMGSSYLRSYFYPSGNNGFGTTVGFKTSKRAAPTMTMYNPSTGAAGTIRDQANSANLTPNVNNVCGSSFAWEAAMTTANSVINMVGHWTADARL